MNSQFIVVQQNRVRQVVPGARFGVGPKIRFRPLMSVAEKSAQVSVARVRYTGAAVARKRALTKQSLLRSASVKSVAWPTPAPLPLLLVKVAPRKLAPASLAPTKDTPSSVVPLKSALRRSSQAKLRPTRVWPA